ncbi:hypothetical protein DYB25_002671 [Aphanomyces astaci]|uniref:Uncharacterized protein n=1 Tax=Aphanomyces astaci TaxID=112090 RepID=A0A397BG65_APHAT|nr:hypothetical protein DYB25_002671 [Aphanomyces astaci]
MLSSKLPNPKVVVEWCPHDSGLFAVGSDALTLFECQVDRDVSSPVHASGLSVRPSLEPLSPRKTTQRRSKDFFRSLQTDAEVSQVRSMQWCPLPQQLIAAGVGTGKVVLSDFTQPVVELLPPRTSASMTMSGKAPRPSMHGTIGCNTVSWNQQNPHHIAAGFEKVRADCCAFVWDLTTQASISSVTSTPLDLLDTTKPSSYRGHGYSSPQPQPRPTLTNELANSEAVVALDWLPSEPSCLATGTGFKWLRIYDIRAKTRFMEFSAHTKGVYGVVFDVHRPHLLATYSDDPKEPIKVWDIRSIQGARHENEPVVTIPVSKLVSQIAWSPTQAGILASTALDDRAISLWDVEHQIQLATSTPPSVLSKPFKRRSTHEPVFAFAWQPGSTSVDEPPTSWNRMLFSTIGGKVESLSVHDTMPLALSSQHALGFACGTLLFADRIPNDIAAHMMRRVRAGYSMNVLTSLQLFIKDDPSTRDLRFVWQWVDQVESLRRLSVAQTEIPSLESRGGMAIQQRAPLRAWPVDPQALVSAGVQHLLGLTTVPSTSVPYETSLRDPVLGCLVYDSLGRRTALLACQWDPEGSQSTTSLHFSNMPRSASGKVGLNQAPGGSWHSLYDDNTDGPTSSTNNNVSSHHTALPTLQSLMSQCEASLDFDRAAALAVFHGDVQAAVAVLQRGAECPTSSPTREVRQLVAMAVAGYSIGTTAHNPLWSSMCQQLLRRPEIQNPGTPRYLHALCSFLVTARELSAVTHAAALPTRPPRNSTVPNSLVFRRPSATPTTSSPEDPPLFTAILHDESLLLSDRTAFACRYLPLDALSRFIDVCVETCTRQGNLQGLLLVGLEPSILQEYLDRTGDIQTVALLVARVAATSEDTALVYAKWIAMYRDLLNQWQLFHQRALFDVGRTQLEGQLNGFRDVALALNHPMATETRAVMSSPPPPQLYVRCNFCGSSLSLSSLLRVGAGDWLLKAKPKLNNCPSCKRPLPQCALCLLPFGTLNPYLELAMRKGQDKKHALMEHDSATSSPSTPDNLSDLSSIPFVEWFTWCQTCKHGGHAHHMADWFATHEVCPVSDCDCTCKRLDVNSTMGCAPSGPIAPLDRTAGPRT